MPETARARTYSSVKPALAAAQLIPLSEERKTPLPSVPAKRRVPDDARDNVPIFVNPVAIQLVPSLVERNPPPPPRVPAKRFVPETARAMTEEVTKPELALVQVVPLFVERKTPP